MRNGVRLAVITIAVAVIAFSCSYIPFNVVAYAENEVYLGGIPLGIGLAENGLIVTGTADVITNDGAVSPTRGSEISVGDVIVGINGKEVVGVQDFVLQVQESASDVTLDINRGEHKFNVVLTPATDILSNQRKLGILVKKGINGIGTLTYVLPDGSFGALGHGIVDNDTKKQFISDEGSVYKGTISGYRRGESGEAGMLLGRFSDRLSKLGSIKTCNKYGVYGTCNQQMYNGLASVKLGDKSDVKSGKAYIYTTIDGTDAKRYEVEILRAVPQRGPSDKSMIIRVVDKQLLETTGGILQGMSGSPIVQNDKLVGAVTHVLLNDATLGYGIYINWMLANNKV